MTFEQFDKLLAIMYEEENEIRNTKAKEYTQGDRLDNFKRLAQELGITSKQVLWVYLKKHLDSIAFYINLDAKSASPPILSEPIEGRIKDARVYLSLLRGLIAEEKLEDIKLRDIIQSNP